MTNLSGTEYARTDILAAILHKWDGVEVYQAGQWRQVVRIATDGRGYVSVTFAGGGTSAAPAHHFTARRPLT